MFRKPTNPEAEESQRAIEAGGLPPAAVARLQENASRQGTPSHLFTSNLSPSELLLTHECGFEPVGQIMGTSAYHVGWQYLPGQTWGSQTNWLPASQELTVLTEAHYEARRLAFGRLLQEAAILKADGVVGVRFERLEGYLPSGTIEFKAIGTAVRRRGAPPSTGTPFLSNLSGQDHWALRKGGLQPIGFVFGSCTWYQVSGWRNQNLNMGGFFNMGNAELPDFTQGVYNARELAMERAEQEAKRIGASGLVGVVIEPKIEVTDVDTGNNNRRRDLIVEFTIYGTAVRTEGSAMSNVDPQFTVSLQD